MRLELDDDDDDDDELDDADSPLVASDGVDDELMLLLLPLPTTVDDVSFAVVSSDSPRPSSFLSFIYTV